MEKSENIDIQVEPTVKSPSREAQLRKGRGFSLGEIKAAGKTVQNIKQLGIRIDPYRKSVLESNIEQLKKLKAVEKKGKKRPPFVRKEKKVRVRKKKVKKKVKPVEDVEVLPKEPAVKATPIAKQKVKAKVKAVPEVKEKVETIPKTKVTPEAKEKVETIPKTKVTPEAKEKPKKKKKEKKEEKKEEKGTALTKLSVLGAATEKKFQEVGVNCIEELVKEKPDELGMLISGISAERITKWINEGQELLNK